MTQIDAFKTIDIMLDRVNGTTILNLDAVEGERSGRGINLTITDGGVVKPLPGLLVSLGWTHRTAKNSEGTALKGLDAFEEVDVAKGIFRILFPAGMMVIGEIDAVIQIIDDDEITLSNPFKINVRRSPLDEDAPVSDNSFTTLTAALTKLSHYDGDIAGLKVNKADKSELAELDEQKASKVQLAFVENELDTIRVGPIDTVSSIQELTTKYPNGARGTVVVLEADGVTGYEYTWTNGAWKKGAIRQQQGVGEKQIETKNLDDSAVSQENLAYEYANIFDVTKSRDGYVASMNGIISSANWSVSEFIPAVAGDVFRVRPANYVVAVAFDAAMTPIWQYDTASNALIERTFVAPENTAFVVLNILRTGTASYMATKNRELSVDYQPLAQKRVRWLAVNRENIEPDSVGSTQLREDAVLAKNMGGKENYVAASINRFDKSAVIENSFATMTGFTANVNWVRTDYIGVTEGDTININLPFNLYAIVYNAAKEATRSFETASSTPTQITILENEAYVILNVVRTNIDAYMYSIDQPLPAEYETFQNEKAEISWLAISARNVSGWNGKNCQWYGDSISWQDGKNYAGTSNIARGYQTRLREKLGFNQIQNLAISGRPIADGSANGVGTVSTVIDSYEITDLVVVSGGTNDFRLDIPLGTLGIMGDTNFDRNTFFGALRSLVEHVLTTSPNQLLLFMAPLQRNNAGYDVNYTNSAGHKLVDYVDAILAVCDLYSLPAWDGYRASGVSQLNFGVNTRDGLHLNDDGYERATRTLIPFLDSMLPFE